MPTRVTLAIAVKSHERKSVIQVYKLNEKISSILDQTKDPIEISVPFQSYLPHITWNIHLQKLEVIGDFVWPYSKKVKNLIPDVDHHFLNPDFETWEESTESCFDGRSYSAVKFIPGLGTLMVGGVLGYKTLGSSVIVRSVGIYNY